MKYIALSSAVRHFGHLRRAIPKRHLLESTRHTLQIRRSYSQSIESVWRLQNVEASYWNDYISTRPKYDATIFNPIFSYHEKGNKNYSDVLDIGTGAGSALNMLTSRFKHVVASDNDTTSLGFAKHRFQHLSPNQLSWVVSRAEDLTRYCATSSFDMVTCALTFPLLDTQKALRAMSTLLRPKGTLAIWFYGPPIFLDPKQAEKGQAALYRALDYAFRPVVNGGGPQGRADWKRAADGMASWLDYVPFSPEQWSDVHRQKWNNEHARLSFFGPSACGFEIEPKSAVSSTETTFEEQDPSFWKVDWDLDTLRRFVLAVFPKPEHMNSADEVMKGHFGELEDAIGVGNVKVPMTWPAVLVLARKNA